MIFHFFTVQINTITIYYLTRPRVTWRSVLALNVATNN